MEEVNDLEISFDSNFQVGCFFEQAGDVFSYFVSSWAGDIVEAAKAIVPVKAACIIAICFC